MTNDILYDYYVEKMGSGQPIIFLPAAGFSGNEGLNIAEYLQNDFETHMIDLPGLGKGIGIQGRRITSLKMAKWVKTYLDQKGIEKISLIGHSMGGAILLAFAVHYPKRVNKLVLLDQGHKPMPRVPTSEFGVFAYSFPVLNLFAMSFGSPFLKLLKPLFSDDEDQEDIDKQVKQFCDTVSIKENKYVRQAMENTVDISIDGLNLMFGYYNLNLPKLLSKIEVPTYLAYATFKGVNEKEYKNTSKRIKRLQQYHQLPITYHPVDGGHYVHWSDSSVLNDLKNFLTQKS